MAGSARIANQFEQKGVELQTDLPNALPGVWVDEDRIVQVLLNLFMNALQFTPQGGVVRIRRD